MLYKHEYKASLHNAFSCLFSGSVVIFLHSTLFESTLLEWVSNNLNPESSRRRRPGPRRRVLKGSLKRSPPRSDTRCISINPEPFFTTHISDGRRRGRWGRRWWWRTRIRLWWGRFPGRSNGTSYPVWNERSRSFWTVVLQLDALGLLTHLGTRGGGRNWSTCRISNMSYCTLTKRHISVTSQYIFISSSLHLKVSGHEGWVTLRDKTSECTK